MPLRRPTNARLRSNLHYWRGLNAHASRLDRMKAREDMLAALGLTHLPGEEDPGKKRKKPRAITFRHVIRRCPGVRVVRNHYVSQRVCGRRMMVTLSGGRPASRCPECRVLKVFWQQFHKKDPIPVIEMLVTLMRKGLIGREQYKRVTRAKEE